MSSRDPLRANARSILFVCFLIKAAYLDRCRPPSCLLVGGPGERPASKTVTLKPRQPERPGGGRLHRVVLSFM